MKLLRILFLVTMSLFAYLDLYAQKNYDFVHNNVYYKIKSSADKTLEIVKGNKEYRDHLILPEKVCFENEVFSVVSIGGAFEDCHHLQSITIPRSIVSISENSFNNCENLKSVCFEDGDTEIIGVEDVSLFKNSILESAYWGRQGKNPFRGMYNLKTLVIGNSVTQIGDSDFLECINLTNVKIGNNVRIIGKQSFAKCQGLEKINLPNSLEFLGEGAFENCANLSFVGIGNHIKKIGKDAFRDCKNLEFVAIGRDIQSIDSAAFWNCTSLAEILLNSTTPPIFMNNTFGTTNSNNHHYVYSTVYIPKGSFSAYEANKEWMQFNYFKEFFTNDHTQCSFNLRMNEGGKVMCNGLLINQSADQFSRRINIRDLISLSIIPDEGCNLLSITKDGKDVTEEMICNTYSDIITEDMSIVVTFESPISNANENLEKNGISVRASNGIIDINGATIGDIVFVYTIDGKLVTKQRVKNSLTKIKVARETTYIVNIGQNSFKLKL